MLVEAAGANCNWFCSGPEFFDAMLRAIDAAQESICLETYIFSGGDLGVRFRETLVRARQRSARVQVLIDAFGSYSLPGGFWKPLLSVGGEVRQFNPLSFNRLGIRNHRKLLVCDQGVAFVGGFNIAPECEGDGVTRGWCDLGLKIEGPLAAHLAASFEEMFGRSAFQHKRFPRLRKSGARKTVLAPNEQLLLSGPGRGRSPIKRALHDDLAMARSVQIMVGYFLPTWRLRHQLVQIARAGGQVRLILAGKSDVAVALLAARSLYRRLLKGKVEIYEYQPQILHAKLFVIDDVVYVGSANLDYRSLNINYELMVRFESASAAAEGRNVFRAALQHCRQIRLEDWRGSRSLWSRFKQRWAYWLLVRLDPYIARRQWRGLPD
jgi:cardiolipin synthase A/B